MEKMHMTKQKKCSIVPRWYNNKKYEKVNFPWPQTKITKKYG